MECGADGGNGGRASGAGSAAARGISRCLVLDLLSAEGPLTGRQIMDCAAARSGNIWRPSPGLVYPLLARLLDEGLISKDGAGDDGQGGRYSATEKGRTAAADARKIVDAARRRVEALVRAARAGRLAAADAMDRISHACTTVCTDLTRMTDEEARDYREFLESEIARVDAAIAGRRGQEIPVEPAGGGGGPGEREP